MYSIGVKTNRDEVIYDFNRSALIDRVGEFIEAYNVDVDRFQRAEKGVSLDDFVHYETVKWSESLKKNVQRGRHAQYDEKKVRTCLYRPFTRRLLFFDELLVERRYRMAQIVPDDGRGERQHLDRGERYRVSRKHVQRVGIGLPGGYSSLCGC